MIAPRATLDKAALFELLQYRPHKAQQLVHDAGPHDFPGRARFRYVCTGVRLGKTTAAANEIVAAALAPTPRQTEFWCAAPTHSLADRTWRAVVAAFNNHLPEHVVRVAEHDGELLIRNLAGFESLILRRSTERPISLVGAGVDGMVIDEASGIGDEAWENGLATRLLDKLGWVLAISSPRGCRGWWYRGLCKALKGDDPQLWGVKLPTWASPLISRDELRKIRERSEPWVWAQEYCGEPVAADGKVFDPAAIAECATGRFADPIPGESYLAGLDIAGTGNDRTVLVIARAGDEGLCEVVKVYAWSRLSFEDMGWRVRAVLRRYNDASVRVDETGLGAPVLQQLCGLGIPASGVTFTAASKNAMVRNLAVMIERARILLPMPEAAPLLHDELAAFEYLDSDSGSLGGLRRMGAPSGHDDHVAALLLASSWFRGGAISGARLSVRGAEVDLGADRDDDDEGDGEREDEKPNPLIRGDAVPDDDELRPKPLVSRSRLDLGHRFGGGSFGLGIRRRG